MNAQGVFYQMPYGPEGTNVHTALGRPPIGGEPLPPLQVTLFTPVVRQGQVREYRADRRTARSAIIKVVYAGGYLVRNVEQQQDYTNYSRGVYGYYYQCAGYSKQQARAEPTGTCFSPAAAWQDTEKNTHQSQELRVSTPDDWRMRGIGGLFWEEFKIYDDTHWLYKTVPTCSPTFNDNCFNNVQPLPGIDREQSECSATTMSDSSTTRRAPSFRRRRSARWTSRSSRRR